MARRLDVRRDLRSHRLVSGGFVNGLIWNLVNVSIALLAAHAGLPAARTDEPRLLFVATAGLLS